MWPSVGHDDAFEIHSQPCWCIIWNIKTFIENEIKMVCIVFEWTHAESELTLISVFMNMCSQVFRNERKRLCPQPRVDGFLCQMYVKPFLCNFLHFMRVKTIEEKTQKNTNTASWTTMTRNDRDVIAGTILNDKWTGTPAHAQPEH